MLTFFTSAYCLSLLSPWIGHYFDHKVTTKPNQVYGYVDNVGLNTECEGGEKDLRYI